MTNVRWLWELFIVTTFAVHGCMNEKVKIVCSERREKRAVKRNCSCQTNAMHWDGAMCGSPSLTRRWIQQTINQNSMRSNIDEAVQSTQNTITHSDTEMAMVDQSIIIELHWQLTNARFACIVPNAKRMDTSLRAGKSKKWNFWSKREKLMGKIKTTTITAAAAAIMSVTDFPKAD